MDLQKEIDIFRWYAEFFSSNHSRKYTFLDD